MALTKINFEVEIEDTFQNGNKLDLQKLYQILQETASAEYNEQFESNRITKHFQISMTTVPEQPEYAALDVTEQVRRRRRSAFGVIGTSPAEKLLLPR